MKLRDAAFLTVIFLGSFLLFLIEPIAGKQLLPLLGGSAAVWTTCLVFFQIALLLGYFCSYLFATKLEPSVQSRVYLILLCAALAQLGVMFDQHLHANTAHPILSAFWLLGTLIGIPFLALSAASPLLQAWYGYTAHTSESVSPYHLYAISNLGSLVALAAYPTLIEPRVTLRGQIAAWIIGFAVFTVLCGAIHWSARRLLNVAASREATADVQSGVQSDVESTVGPGALALWVLLPACASLLLCAVTNYLSQNVAPVPMLWVIPLGVYLLSFVVAFNGRTLWPRWLMLCVLAVVLGSAGYVLYTYDESVLHLAAIPILCTVLFVACLFCHGEVYRLRPRARDLTSFYLCVAGGGAAGAVFVGVVTPVIFAGNYELFWGLIFLSVLAAAVSWQQGVAWFVLYGAGAVAMGFLLRVQVRTYEEDTIARMRSFYGALRVTELPLAEGPGTLRDLYNGTIEHGTELYGTGSPLTPTTYYGNDSGVGFAMNFCCAEKPRRVGVIGLGAGTMAAYGRPGDVFRFYEINPMMEYVARNFFTYLSESLASIQIVLGDARVSLSAEPPQQFDVLVVDAFSGDAVPVHLLTAQAIALYQRHLKPAGILAMHVSSQYLDLAPVVQQQADHAGLRAILIDSVPDEDLGEYAADWVLVTANTDFLAVPEVVEVSEDISVPKTLRLWEDDYSSLLPLLRWKGPTEADDETPADDHGPASAPPIHLR
jgi:spermidine synthase